MGRGLSWLFSGGMLGVNQRGAACRGLDPRGANIRSHYRGKEPTAPCHSELAKNQVIGCKGKGYVICYPELNTKGSDPSQAQWCIQQVHATLAGRAKPK